MKLKDCPVGSVIRCVRWNSSKELPSYVEGKFTVEKDGDENFFISNDGVKWYEYECENDEYEIVSQPDAETQKTKKIYFKGKHYILKPLRSAEVIEIDVLNIIWSPYKWPVQ